MEKSLRMMSGANWDSAVRRATSLLTRQWWISCGSSRSERSTSSASDDESSTRRTFRFGLRLSIRPASTLGLVRDHPVHAHARHGLGEFIEIHRLYHEAVRP